MLNQIFRRLLPARAHLSPADVSLDFLAHTLDRVMDLLPAFPSTDLTARQRRRLGGNIYARCELAISETADALRRHPALFPDIPDDPDQLQRRLLRASYWLRIAAALREMAARADDQHLLELSVASRQTTDILSHVRAPPPSRFYATPLHPERRRAALWAALLPFEDYLRGCARKPPRFSP